MSEIVTLKTVLLSLQMVFSPETAITTTAADVGKIYACPRCRRAKPPGPLKRPHQGFPKEGNNQ